MKEKKELTYQVLSKHRTLLMGLAILSILVFHYTEDCMLDETHYFGIIKLYKNFIGSGGVDAFLFLSGIGLYYSLKKRFDVKEFYQRRVIRLLIPYALICIPAWYVYDILIQGYDAVHFVKDVFFITFFTKEDHTIWFWYIIVMLFCYIIYPYIFKMLEQCQTVAQEKALVSSWIALVVLMGLVLRVESKSLFGLIEIGLLRIPAFLLGCVAGKACYEARRISSGLWIVGGVVFLLQLADTAKIMTRFVMGLTVILVLILAAVIAEYISITWISSIIEWFGRCSIEIYLIHVAVRKIMRTLEYKTSGLIEEAMMLLISFILVVVIHFIIAKVTKLIERK